jgi:hypothetical protein
MSEPTVAPVVPISSAPRPPGTGLSKKLGPLPGYGWIGVGLAGGLVYLWWRSRRGTPAASTDPYGTTATDTGTAGTDFSGQLATLQTEIQQLQGEQSADTDGAAKPPGKKAALHRHVSTGKFSLLQLAKSRHTSIAELLSLAHQSPEDKANLAKLDEWAKHPARKEAGIVYFTRNP